MRKKHRKLRSAKRRLYHPKHVGIEEF